MYLGILLQKDSVLLFSLAMPCLPHVTHFVSVIPPQLRNLNAGLYD